MHRSRSRVKTRLLFITILLTITVAGILDLTTQLQPNSVSQPRLASTSSHVHIWLNGDAVGNHPGWNDSSPGPTITVTSGVTVSLMLNATDILMHNWFIDTQRNYTPDPNGISSPDFSFSATRVVNFTFTPIIGQNIPAAGNWTYRCKYHPFPYMYGTIKILQAQNPDFTITATPDQITTTVETTATTIVTVSPTSSFTGTVNLASKGSNGLVATITPQTINTGSGTATLEMIAPSAVNYTATITATSGSLTHTLNITVQATDYTINANPNMTSIMAGTQATSTITLQPVNHFTGTVTLTTNSTICNLNPTSITSQGTSTLSCNSTSPGILHVSVIGTSGTLTHNTTVTVTVQDFSITATPTTVNENVNVTGTSTITVTGISGFDAVVSLTTNSTSCTLTPTNVTGQGIAKLSCSFTTTGNFTVQITATAGSTLHTTIVVYNVTQSVHHHNHHHHGHQKHHHNHHDHEIDLTDLDG